MTRPNDDLHPEELEILKSFLFGALIVIGGGILAGALFVMFH